MWGMYGYTCTIYDCLITGSDRIADFIEKFFGAEWQCKKKLSNEAINAFDSY